MHAFETQFQGTPLASKLNYHGQVSDRSLEFALDVTAEVVETS